MNKKYDFLKKLKNNKYIKIFKFSLFSYILSFLVATLFAYIEHSLTLEILYYILILLLFIFIYHSFNKNNLKLTYSFNNLIIPWLFLFLILYPLVTKTIYELNHTTYPIPWYSNNYWRATLEKPIIYLYPEEKQDINVRLEVEWELIADYPKYDDNIKGWNVTAYPDGRVMHNGKEYSYLFWEALFENNDWDLRTGFIVEGKDAREFLEEKLSYMWLTPKEYNEFIVYWYPKMMNNKYNLIHFAGADYDLRAPLSISPKPDSLLRVFMVIKPLDEKIEIKEQKLSTFERIWFSVVEWWGTLLWK